MIKDLIASILSGKGRTAALFVLIYALALAFAARLNSHEFRITATEALVLSRTDKIQKVDTLSEWMARHEERETATNAKIGEMAADVKELLRHQRANK